MAGAIRTLQRRRRAALVAATLALAMVCWGSGLAQATVREWLMEQHGLDPDVLAPTPSVRLMGLGSAGLAVIDEENELNLHDFAGNVAGILDDSDRWVVESWMGNHIRLSEGHTLDTEQRYGHGGLHVTYRSDVRALGAEVNWSYLETDEMPGDWTRIRGPLASGLINQRVGRFTLGMMLGRESENEDRHSSDFFSIRHTQARWVGRLGLQAPLAGWLLGAEWQFESGDVIGKSVDPARFHEDTYTWSRPVDRYVLAAVLPRTGVLEGGVRLALMDRKGSEEVEVSWSDDSPQNPSQTDHFDTAVTFQEEESALEVATQWRLHLGARSILGTAVSYRDWDHQVFEGVNYKGSAAGGSWSDQALTVGLGLSQLLWRDRLLASVEGRVRQTDWMAADALGQEEATSRNMLLGIGLEFFPRPDIALRGGFGVGSSDRDIDAPLTMRSLQSISGGVSWLPRGGLVQLTGALRYGRWEPTEEEATNLETEDETSFALGLRLLL